MKVLDTEAVVEEEDGVKVLDTEQTQGLKRKSIFSKRLQAVAAWTALSELRLADLLTETR